MFYSTEDLRDLVALWGPRVLAAIAIIVVAFIVGRALKWAIAKGVDRIPALAHHNAGLPPQRTAGANLGEVAYWLVLLIGVVAALNALQLAQVAGPLNTLLTNVLGYIPNVVGAGLIFFVGFIIATLAKRLVTGALAAANVDGLLARAGLSPTQVPAAGGGAGASRTLANAVGTLVFVLILIPVAIAALQTLRIEAISAPAIAVLNTILNAIPHVIAAAIVLAIGFVIGRWIAGVVERVLPATGFDRVLGGLGALTSLRPKPDGGQAPAAQATAVPRVTPSKVVANLVLAAIVVFAAIEAARLLQFAAIAAILGTILGLATKIVVGAAIIAVGVVIADILANFVARSGGQVESFASTVIRWAAIALAVAMGLSFMGIAQEIVFLAFGLILGSAAVAAALAFGLGGRQAAGRLADGWVQKIQQGGVAAPRPGPQPAPMTHSPQEPRTFGGDKPPASPT